MKCGSVLQDGHCDERDNRELYAQTLARVNGTGTGANRHELTMLVRLCRGTAGDKEQQHSVPVPVAAAAAAAAATDVNEGDKPVPMECDEVDVQTRFPWMDAFERVVSCLSEGKPWDEDMSTLLLAAASSTREWFKFSVETLQQCQRSPCVCMVISHISSIVWKTDDSDSLCWTTLLPAEIRRCATMLANGMPSRPFEVSRLQHRVDDFVGETVPWIRRLASSIPHNYWMVLTGCFYPWLVFAVSALVQECTTRRNEQSIDALSWFVTFMFVDPVEQVPNCFSSFSQLLLQFIDSSSRVCKTPEYIHRRLEETVPSSSSKPAQPLPPCLRSLCLSSLHLAKYPSTPIPQHISQLIPALSMYSN